VFATNVGKATNQMGRKHSCITVNGNPTRPKELTGTHAPPSQQAHPAGTFVAFPTFVATTIHEEPVWFYIDFYGDVGDFKFLRPIHRKIISNEYMDTK